METSIKPKEYYKWYERTPRSLLQRDASIIEDYIAHRYSIASLGLKYRMVDDEIAIVLSKYFKYPPKNITLKSKII